MTLKWSSCKIAKDWTLTTSVTGPSRTKFLAAPLGPFQEVGMKVRSLVVFSNHSAFHRWSAQSAHFWCWMPTRVGRLSTGVGRRHPVVTVDLLLTRSNHGTWSVNQAHSFECRERSIVALFVCSQRHIQFFVRRVRVRWSLRCLVKLK